MIHRVFANKTTFREVQFQPGFNVVLAERTEDATAGDSRNGVGKSTLIDIIHFCFGSTANRDHPLRREELSGWEFSIEFDLVGMTVTATRAVDEPGRVRVSITGRDWPIEAKVDEETGEKWYSNDQWKAILGWGFFKLPAQPGEAERFQPSFRSLISYLCRRGPNAYTSPFKHFPAQSTWEIQVHIAFLLGLGWRNASRWQLIREEIDGLDALKKAAKSGVVAGLIGTEGELEAKRVEIESVLKSQQNGLATFKVHPEYERIQEEANTLTDEIQGMARKGLMLRRKRDLYHKATKDEIPPEEKSLETVYREAGVALGDSVKKTLDEAREFHVKLVSNRQQYLAEEIQRIGATIEKLDTAIQVKSDARASLFSVLETHGAFDEFARLSEEMARTRQEHEKLTERLDEIKTMTRRRQELRAERLEVEQSATRDYDERREVWSRAVRIYNENSEALYDSSGRLIIDVSDTGYRFSVESERQGSEGISKMEVFCFDLMVAELHIEDEAAPKILIHDSILFDGVDSRQRARAIMRAAERSSECDFQYICTLNTDMVPIDDFDEDFDITPYVRLTLRDGDATGSLLGVRF